MLALLQTPIRQPEGRTTPISIPNKETAYLPTLLDLPANPRPLGAHRGHHDGRSRLVAHVPDDEGFEFRAAGLNPRGGWLRGHERGPDRSIWRCSCRAAWRACGRRARSSVRPSYLSPSIGRGYGWDAIALALLAGLRPGGVVFAGLPFRRPAGRRPKHGHRDRRTRRPAGLHLALVIMFVAAPRLVREIYRVRMSSAAPTTPLSRGRGDPGMTQRVDRRRRWAGPVRRRAPGAPQRSPWGVPLRRRGAPRLPRPAGAGDQVTTYRLVFWTTAAVEAPAPHPAGRWDLHRDGHPDARGRRPAASPAGELPAGGSTWVSSSSPSSWAS